MKANKNKKVFSGNYVTLVKSSKTNNEGVIKRRVLCRPLKASAAGEVSFCRVLVTRKGGVKVKVVGYNRVKVTVFMTARPKAAFKNDWRPTRFRETWILRGKGTRNVSNVSAAGAFVSLKLGAAS